MRYTPPGGKIDLIWRMDHDVGKLIVADTGIGIPAQHLPRLTERFIADRSRSRETGGTGLGLAIVKHVLTRHHATLDIESEPGKGSRFTARFPRECLSPSFFASAERETNPLEIRPVLKNVQQLDLRSSVRTKLNHPCWTEPALAEEQARHLGQLTVLPA